MKEIRKGVVVGRTGGCDTEKHRKMQDRLEFASAKRAKTLREEVEQQFNGCRKATNCRAKI